MLFVWLYRFDRQASYRYNCLVPQKDEKGKVIFCNASYSQNELLI